MKRAYLCYWALNCRKLACNVLWPLKRKTMLSSASWGIWLLKPRSLYCVFRGLLNGCQCSLISNTGCNRVKGHPVLKLKHGPIPNLTLTVTSPLTFAMFGNVFHKLSVKRLFKCSNCNLVFDTTWALTLQTSPAPDQKDTGLLWAHSSPHPVHSSPQWSLYIYTSSRKYTSSYQGEIAVFRTAIVLLHWVIAI